MTRTNTPRTKTTRKTIRPKTPATKPKKDVALQMTEQFRELRLPSFRDHFQETATRATTENLSHLDYLSELTTLECEARREGRIKRLLTRSRLPLGKTWDSFDFARLPLNVTRQMETLRDGQTY